MPDHIHAFGTPGLVPMPSLKTWVAYWKRLVSEACPQVDRLWQRDFWDLQMRSYAHYVERRSYVRENPVRKGLVPSVRDWPYQGELHTIEW
jgi:REP element-mobilizing transposase RayT